MRLSIIYERSVCRIATFLWRCSRCDTKMYWTRTRSYNVSNNSTHVGSRKHVFFLVEWNSYHICRCSISRTVESTNFIKMCFLWRTLWCPNSRASYWYEMYDARADCTTRVQRLRDCHKNRSRYLDEREHWRTPHKTRLRDSRKEFPQVLRVGL